MPWLTPTLNALRPNASKAFEAGAFTPTTYNGDRIVGTVTGTTEEDAWELVNRIGVESIRVSVGGRASKSAVLQAWHGAPAPDPDATYLTLQADAASLKAISNGASVSIEVA